jgi:YihY family inner membrane protein
MTHEAPSSHKSGGRQPPAKAATVDSADNSEASKPPNRLETLVLRIDRFQQDHAVFGFPFAVVQKFGNDQAGGKATLITYYGLFALFPLLLLLTTVLGYLLRDNKKLENDLINSALGNFPIIGDQLRSQTHPLTGSPAAIFFGSVLLVYGSIGLGLAAQSAMNTVWNVPFVRWPSFPIRYLRGLAILGLLALSTVGATILTGFATLVSHGWETRALLVVGSLVANFALILLAFKVMTAKHYVWRDIALGAALASIFWQALQLVGSWYMGRELQHSTATYGFFGVVLALLAWIYLGAQLFLLAAEINVVQHNRLWPRTMTQPPLIEGDRKVFERLAQMEVRRPEFSLDVHFLPSADHDRLAALAGPPDT